MFRRYLLLLVTVGMCPMSTHQLLDRRSFCYKIKLTCNKFTNLLGKASWLGNFANWRKYGELSAISTSFSDLPREVMFVCVVVIKFLHFLISQRNVQTGVEQKKSGETKQLVKVNKWQNCSQNQFDETMKCGVGEVVCGEKSISPSDSCQAFRQINICF